MWTRFAASILFRLPCNLQSRVSLFLAGEPDLPAGRQTKTLKETIMRTMTRTRIYLPMAALIVTAALALPAPAQQQVPFKGTFQGSDAVTPPTTTESNTGTGTLLGQFSSNGVFSFSTRLGSARWIAANGDIIETTFVASAGPVDMAPCQVVSAQPE